MIREAQLVDRVPYMLIVGQKEVEDGTVSIRSRDTAKTETMTLDNFTLKSQMKSKIVYKKSQTHRRRAYEFVRYRSHRLCSLYNNRQDILTKKTVFCKLYFLQM